MKPKQALLFLTKGHATNPYYRRELSSTKTLKMRTALNRTRKMSRKQWISWFEFCCVVYMP